MVTAMTVKCRRSLEVVRHSVRRLRVMPRAGSDEHGAEQRVDIRLTLPYRSCPWASAFSSAYSFRYLVFRLAKRIAAP